MRVAHILRKYVPAEWGGTETALHRLADGLGKHGVSSVAYCPVPPEPTKGPDPLAESGCEVKRYRACMPVWGLSPEAERQMFALGGNILSFELPRMLARDNIDVVHTHALGRIAGIAGTVARRRRLPFVVSIHGGVLDVPDDVKRARETPAHNGVEWGRVFGWWYRVRKIYDEADLILTCNPREAELLQARHPGRRIVVHPHGVPLAPFGKDQRAAARAAFPGLEGRDILLCIARIDPVKNQAWLVQQMPEILQRHPNAHLVLAGACTDAAYGAQVNAEINRLGLQDRVLLTGGLPPGDPRLIGLLQWARAFTLASLAEPFGIVLIEAMAAGTPVIASRTSGAVSIVTDAKDGWLFEPAKPASFHQALDRTLRESDAATRLIAEGHQTAAKYDTAVLAGRLRTLYATLREEKNALRHPA